MSLHFEARKIDKFWWLAGCLFTFCFFLRAEDFSTKEGDTYTNCTIKRVEPDGILIAYPDGIKKLKFEHLSEETQKKYGYDPIKLKQYQADRISALLAHEKQSAIQKKVDIAFEEKGTNRTLYKEKANPSPESFNKITEFDENKIFSPCQEGMDEGRLLALAEWVRNNPHIPIYSILISRHGHLVFELYTGKISRDHSHYLMSVTKSFLSTLIGIAIDKGIIKSEDYNISELISDNIKKQIHNNSSLTAINHCTLKNIMGMSALDIKDPPRDNSSESIILMQRFIDSRNRFLFSINQKFLNNIGSASIYNDETPVLASGILSYNSGVSAIDFATENLFRPLAFKNYEWMHQDPSGINMGGYGLRVRPIDMQKLGNLFLNSGFWHGQKIVSKEWIEKTKVPYIHLNGSPIENYGYFWWKDVFSNNLSFQTANGWKGQRIAINYDNQLVVTMTGCIERDEFGVFSKIMNEFIIPSLDTPNSTSHLVELQSVITSLQSTPPRYINAFEPRMVPSIQNKEKSIPFRP